MKAESKRSTLKRTAKWLYPGIGVKRWAGLVALSATSAVLGILGLLGKELVLNLYAVFVPKAFYAYLLWGLLIVGGALGVAFGVNMFLRSIVRGVAPWAEKQTADILYGQRILSRGPKIVAIGGGTGLSTILRGLKEITSNITAVVTVMDDGGSSGKLRRELKMLPPGDIRNCIIALAEDESKIAEIFQHRFRKSGSLNGHSLGNLVIAAMKEMTGSFDKAIEEMSYVLNIRGQVLPATLEHADLVAEMEDGHLVKGESEIAADPRRIKRMRLSKPKVTAYPKVLDEIKASDIIVLGPGSLFTSLIPNLLVEGIAEAIEKSEALKFYVVNLMTQPGETDNFTVSDHIKKLAEYIDISIFDYVITNMAEVPTHLLKQYRKDHSVPVENDLSEENEWGLAVVRAPLVDVVELEGKPTVKHDAKKLAKLIVELSKAEFERFPLKSLVH